MRAGAGALGAVLLLGLVACGGDDPAADEPATPAAEAERVVVLGEEFLLADVLALGVEPVAATSTLGDRFAGIPAELTEDIEPLSATEVDLEQVLALRPDLVILSQFVADEVGSTIDGAMFETLVVPEGGWREQVTSLAAGLDAEAEAEQLLADYDAAVEESRAAVEGTTVTLATVYPQESVAAWVDGPSNVPATFLDAGVTLTPGAGTDGASNGRVFLSAEQWGLLDAPVMVLSQSDAVEGEADSLAAIGQNPRWRALPAVAAGSVVEIDRLAYPGVEGRTRLAQELPELLG